MSDFREEILKETEVQKQLVGIVEEQNEVINDSEKEGDRLKRDIRYKDWTIILLIITIILLLFIRRCDCKCVCGSNQVGVHTSSYTESIYSDSTKTANSLDKEEELKVQTGEYVEKEYKPQEVSRGRVYIPAITDFTITKDYPYLTLFSPEDNAGNYYLKYEFIDNASGKMIYESDYLEGGFKYSVDFGALLESGEYDVTVNVSSKDVITLEDKNGATSQIHVVVE